MSCIVYQTKKNGATYAYESVSYWDKEKGQPRSKRKYLGRVDPETGEIVKKSDTNKKQSSDPALLERIQELESKLALQEKQTTSLQQDLSQLQKKYHKAQELLHRIHLLSSRSETEE